MRPHAPAFPPFNEADVLPLWRTTETARLSSMLYPSPEVCPKGWFDGWLALPTGCVLGVRSSAELWLEGIAAWGGDGGWELCARWSPVLRPAWPVGCMLDGTRMTRRQQSPSSPSRISVAISWSKSSPSSWKSSRSRLGHSWSVLPPLISRSP